MRELRNYIERSLILGTFPDMGDTDGPQADDEASLEAVEQRHILAMLERCGGNQSEAARRLGISRKTIERKLQSWGMG